MTTQEITKRVMEAAPVDWAGIVERLTPEMRQDVMRELAVVMQAAGAALGYMEGRFLYEQRPHASGVKGSNALRTKVRKALGYAYPKAADINF